jgi:hypothetical protein
VAVVFPALSMDKQETYKHVVQTTVCHFVLGCNQGFSKERLRTDHRLSKPASVHFKPLEARPKIPVVRNRAILDSL